MKPTFCYQIQVCGTEEDIERQQGIICLLLLQRKHCKIDVHCKIHRSQILQLTILTGIRTKMSSTFPQKYIPHNYNFLFTQSKALTIVFSPSFDSYPCISHLKFNLLPCFLCFLHVINYSIYTSTLENYLKKTESYPSR